MHHCSNNIIKFDSSVSKLHSLFIKILLYKIQIVNFRLELFSILFESPIIAKLMCGFLTIH